jgi:hypothetical protein
MNPNLKAQKTYKKYTKYINKWFTRPNMLTYDLVDEPKFKGPKNL